MSREKIATKFLDDLIERERVDREDFFSLLRKLEENPDLTDVTPRTYDDHLSISATYGGNRVSLAKWLNTEFENHGFLDFRSWRNEGQLRYNYLSKGGRIGISVTCIKS